MSEESLPTRDFEIALHRRYVNVVITGKHPAQQELVMDAAVKHRTKGIGISLKQQCKDKLIEHSQTIGKHGLDIPEIPNWKPEQ